MTTKVLEALSPPDQTIEILLGDGVSGTLNINPCRYPVEGNKEERINLCVVLSEAADGRDDLEIDMIFLVNKSK